LKIVSLKDQKSVLQRLNTINGRIGNKNLTMQKPKLVLTTPQGGTVHQYPLTGGKTTFERYLSCYTGSCKFFNDIDGAKKHLVTIEPKD